MKIYVNINVQNQIKLLQKAFQEAWDNKPTRMKKLLVIMNTKVGKTKFYKEELEEIETRPEEDQRVFSFYFKTRKASIKKKIKEIEKQNKKVSDVRKEYHEYIDTIKQAELKKHPKKYKTRWVEQKDVD